MPVRQNFAWHARLMAAHQTPAQTSASKHIVAACVTHASWRASSGMASYGIRIQLLYEHRASSAATPRRRRRVSTRRVAKHRASCACVRVGKWRGVSEGIIDCTRRRRIINKRHLLRLQHLAAMTTCIGVNRHHEMASLRRIFLKHQWRHKRGISK